MIFVKMDKDHYERLKAAERFLDMLISNIDSLVDWPEYYDMCVAAGRDVSDMEEDRGEN